MVRKKITVRVSEELYSRLEQCSKELGISLSKLVEKILAEHFGVSLDEDPLKPIEALSKELAELRKRLLELERRVEKLEKQRQGLGRWT